MQQLSALLSLPIFRNSFADWLLAAALAIGIMSTLLVLRRLARRHHQRLLKTERVEIIEVPLEVLARTTLLFFIAVALFTGLNTLDMSQRTRLVLNSAITIALFLQAGLWAAAGTTAWLGRKQRSAMTTDRAIAGSLGIIAFIAKGVIWAMVILLILDNLGVNITALVAGLGIGGIAVALAVQNILGDLFASLSITFDKPFFVGDFLIIDDFMGSVEHIGIKSTRLRSLSGEQIIMSNADLLKSRVRNYGRMNERRVVFATTVTYETPAAKLEQIPSIVRSVVEAQEGVRFDRSHFSKHAAASLDFETVYYVLSADYNRYMDIQQAINLRIHREFERLGVEFAYPTQRILLERAGGRSNMKVAANA
jgi:small-conductance mechanosensitive channel